MTSSSSGSWTRHSHVASHKRETPTPELRCPTCAAEVQRFWANCSNCGRRLEWRDTTKETGAESYYCGWVVLRHSSRRPRSEEHTSELQSQPHIVFRPLLQNK